MNTLKEIITDHIKYRTQIVKLAKSNLRKKYKGTALGMLWAIIKPCITIGVYYFAFSVGLRTAKPVGEYAYFLWLIAGMVPWFFMRDVFTGSVSSIKKYKYLVTRIKYPVSTISTFTSMSSMLVHLMTMGVVCVFFILSGHMPDIYWLQIPLYTVMMFMFFNAWSLFAGILGTISSDFSQLVRSIVMALFWLSGIMYSVEKIKIDIIREILLFNPITIVVNGYRNSLIYKVWFWEDFSPLINFAVVYVVMVMLSLWVYKKLRKDLPDVM